MADGAGMSADRWFVVKAEPCPQNGCDPHEHYFDAYCDGCTGRGSRLDVSSAIPVESMDPDGWPSPDGDYWREVYPEPPTSRPTSTAFTPRSEKR